VQQCQALSHATIFQGAKVIFADLGQLLTVSLGPARQEQLGGGCELALMAEILAAPDAQFGQPEVNIITIAGSEARSGLRAPSASPARSSSCSPAAPRVRTTPSRGE